MGLFSKIAGIFKGSEKKDKKNLDPENALEILMLVQEAMVLRDDPERLTAVLARIQQVANQELAKYLPLLTGPYTDQDKQIEILQNTAAEKPNVAFDVHEDLSQDRTAPSQKKPTERAESKPTQPVVPNTPKESRQNEQAPIVQSVEVPPIEEKQPSSKIEIQPELMEKLIAAVQAHPQAFENTAATVQNRPKVQEESTAAVREGSKVQENPAPIVQKQPEIQEKSAPIIQEKTKIPGKTAPTPQEQPKTSERPNVKTPAQSEIAEKIAAVVVKQSKVQEKPTKTVQERPKVQRSTVSEIPEISKTRTLNEIMDSLPDSVREVIAQSIKRNEVPAEEQRIEKAPEPEVIRADRFSGKKVLYAYGNAEDDNIIQSTCKAWQIDLETVANGLTAVKQFSASAPGTYDAIILEKSMPLMNGFMAAKCIRKDKHPESESIPVIVAAVGTPVGQLEREGENISACLDQGTELELYDVFNAIWK